MDQTNNGRLSEAIALQIAELILSGEMKNGTKLRQEELAGMLQVSRIPVREALQLLETQGLAKRLATRHIVTAELTDEHIRQMYAMIADIEYSAVESIRVEMRADEDDAHLKQTDGVDAAEKKLQLVLMDGPVLGGNMAWHRMIINKTLNLYIQTLLMNAVTYYVSYAEKVLLEQHGNDEAMREASAGEQSNTARKELLMEHYRALADAVIAERRKHDDFA